MTLPQDPRPGRDAEAAKAVTIGTHRTKAPADTLAAVKPLLAELGITRVANVTGMDHVGIPTVMVVRPNARSLSVSQGKGIDLDSARASGVMEAIEQWHAERVSLPLHLASRADLAADGRHTVAVERLPRSVHPLDAGDRILWVAAEDLFSGQTQLLPYEMVHLDLRLPLPEGSGHFPIGSNGLASGNTRLEATLHGLWEVIERDASTLFFRCGIEEQRARRIDPASVQDQDAACGQLLERFARAEIDVAIWETTSDVGIPSFLCAALDRRFDAFRPIGLARGAGCHPDAAVALARALTEAAQSRLTRIVGSRDDMQRGDIDRLKAEATDQRHRLQMATATRPERRLADIASHRFPSFEQDLEWTLAELRRVGIDTVAVVDLSRPRFPVHVVRVVVPGLEGHSETPGYVPGPRAAALAAALQRTAP